MTGGDATTPPIPQTPSYDPPIQIVDLSSYDIPRLGCGLYEILITERGAGTTVCASNVMHPIAISFGRRLNEISEASITLALPGKDSDCCDCLSTVRPWRNELRISRDGASVWVGPIMGMLLNPNNNTLKITARDLVANFDKRLFYSDTDYEVEDIPITEVFDDLLQHGYLKDSWNMTFRLFEVAIPTSRFYPGFDPDPWGGRYPIIGDELRSLVEAGVDYTVVNRIMYIGNVEQAFNQHYFDLNAAYPTQTVLLDQSWAELPTIEVVGTYMSNYTVVGGGYTGYYGWAFDQMWVEDAGIDGPFTDGLLETVHISNSTEDVFTDEHPNPITAEARARNEFNRNPYVVLTGGQLAPDAPFGFELLIPGLVVRLGLSAGCVGLDTRYRIHSVSAEMTSDSESVSIELAPIGSENLRG